MTKSKIEWTDRVWNPVTGCTKVSDGCKHCYAEVMALRLQAMGIVEYARGFGVTVHQDRLRMPLLVKKPSRIFVNSMSDLFHVSIPFEFVKQVFSVMNIADWHTFQILTKRSAHLRLLSDSLTWTPNIWMGVSIENNKFVSRADDLRQTGAHVKFLSLEPLLGPLPDLDLTDIQWVIAGCESGLYRRPAETDWFRDIRDRCVSAGIPFFLKQMSVDGKVVKMPELDGQVWNQFPVSK